VAQGGGDSGEGVLEVGPDQAGGLGEVVRERRAAGIWAGWSDHCEIRRERCGGGLVLVVAGKKKGENSRKEELGLVL
jgi:hypothetical protein